MSTSAQWTKKHTDRAARDGASGWYDAAEYGDTLAAQLDGYGRLPEPGDNDVLDAFVAQKHIDINALVRLGARMSGYRVIVFPYHGGLKYRDLTTGRRWATEGAEFDRLKLIHAGAQPRKTIIVTESETDAARLMMLYDADVAVLPAGAKSWKPAFAAQLDSYAQVLGAHDPDDAGEAGFAKLVQALPHAQRFAPPDRLEDWAALPIDTEPPVLPDPADAPRRGLLASRVLLGQLVRDGVPPPEFQPTPSLGEDLLYRRHLTIVAGHKKVGKTLLTTAAAMDAIAAGQPVVYLDFENGPEIIAERFEAMGADPTALDEHFHYIPLPEGLTLENVRGRLGELAGELPGALIIIDSLRGLFGRLSLTSRVPLEVNNPLHLEQVWGRCTPP